MVCLYWVFSMMELLMLLFLTQASFVKGTFFWPVAYTFPDGLQSVNGSSSTGGCQPESCVMMPYSGTAMNGCDCPGSTLASGVLIDGVIPSIDTAQNGTWASELFVVNRDGQDSLMIGFQFSDIFFLRHVDIVYLDCPIWGIRLSAMKVYSSFVFPIFSSAAFINVGTLSLANETDQSCAFLRIMSIPLQPTLSTESYFIEFILRGSNAHPINWLHLAEISFNDVAPTTMMLITLTVSSESITSPAITTLEATTTMFSTTESGEDDNIMTTTATSTTDTSTGRSSDSNMDATLPTIINTPTTVSAVPVPVFVGTLVVVIAVLILLTVIIAMLCIRRGRTQKEDAADGDTEYDDVIVKAIELSGATNPIEMKTNEAYGTHRYRQQDNNIARILETSTEAHYEELH